MHSILSPGKTSHVLVNLRKSSGLLDKRKPAEVEVAGNTGAFRLLR